MGSGVHPSVVEAIGLGLEREGVSERSCRGGNWLPLVVFQSRPVSRLRYSPSWACGCTPADLEGTPLLTTLRGEYRCWGSASACSTT
jgi:hypothetical protein